MKSLCSLSVLALSLQVTAALAGENAPQNFDESRFASAVSNVAASLNLAEVVAADQSFIIGTDGQACADTGGVPLNAFSLGLLSADFPNNAPSKVTFDVVSRASLKDGSGDKCGASPFEPAVIEAMVVDAAQRNGVDPSLATALAWQESRFDRNRNSPKGARGPMQLMPETAKRFGVMDICDPAANIDGGIRYLKLLLDQFKNPLIAAAAYNAGEQAIYASNGVPPYPETVRYVAAVINRQLGLDFSDKRPGKGTKPETASENIPHKTDVLGARAPKFVGGVMQF